MANGFGNVAAVFKSIFTGRGVTANVNNRFLKRGLEALGTRKAVFGIPAVVAFATVFGPALAARFGATTATLGAGLRSGVTRIAVGARGLAPSAGTLAKGAFAFGAFKGIQSLSRTFEKGGIAGLATGSGSVGGLSPPDQVLTLPSGETVSFFSPPSGQFVLDPEGPQKLVFGPTGGNPEQLQAASKGFLGFNPSTTKNIIIPLAVAVGAALLVTSMKKRR